MKRTIACLLLLCTLFVLCACPGGSPVEPPANQNCPTCGKDPCECPEVELCPICGKYPCECAIDPSEVFGEGTAIEGTGDSLSADAPCLTENTYNEADATEKAASDIFRLEYLGSGVIRAGGTSTVTLKNQQNKTYAGTSTVLLLGAGLSMSNNKNLTVKNVTIVGDVEIASGENIVFENVQFLGKVTVKNRASGVVFNGCRLTALESASKNLSAVNSFIAFEDVGISSSGDGLYVQNCRFEGTGTAISATGADIEIRLCSITSDKDGVGVEIKGEDAVNALVALSVIRGVQKSVSIEGATNAVVVRNSLISVYTKENTNVYVCDNQMGGRLFGEANNYFLADGNKYPADGKSHRASLEGNENTNGDTITNVNERLDVGANEALLPHLNKDLFFRMERKTGVKEFGAASEKTLYTYITNTAKTSDVVIVAPGAYEVNDTAAFTAIHNNTTVYAYGVLAEAVDPGEGKQTANYNKSHITTNGVKGLTVKGLSIGFAQQSCGQVYVLEKKGNNQVTVVTGAGFRNEFSLTGSYFMRNTQDIGIVRAGTNYSLGDCFIQSVTKNSNGTMTVTMHPDYYDIVAKGDILTCRLGAYGWMVHTKDSQDITFMDFTQYGMAGGYAFYEENNLNGTRYYRVADTTKAGMEITKSVYDTYRNLETTYGVDLEISREKIDGEYVYRGPAAKISSLDGIHATSCVQGPQIVSSILENMTDDATNMNAYHARLADVIMNKDGTTATLVYKACLTSRLWGTGKKQPDGKRQVEYIRYCADFRDGDRVYIYNAAGQLFCDTKAIGDGFYYDTIRSNCEEVVETDILRYAVVVNKNDLNMAALTGYDLTDDSHYDPNKVLVDNMSRSSANILIDNSLLQNGNTNAIRAKSGVAKNNTIRDIAKTALSCVYDIWWGESVVADGFTFENNLIDHTSYNIYGAPALDHPSADYKYTPICIMGLGGEILEKDYLLFKNITIKGNKFINRDLSLYNYLAFIRAATNVKFIDNDFGMSEDENGMDKQALVLYLNGACNIELSGNTYSPLIEGFYNYYVHGDIYKDVFGTDIGDKIVDKIPAPEK